MDLNWKVIVFNEMAIYFISHKNWKEIVEGILLKGNIYERKNELVFKN